MITACLDAGLVVISAGAAVLRLAPRSSVGPAEVDRALEILTEVLSA